MHPKSLSFHSGFKPNIQQIKPILIPQIQTNTRKKVFKSLHFHETKQTEKNNEEDDYENDALLGSLTKSISSKMENLVKGPRKNSSQINKSDPFINDTPGEFIKHPSLYDKTFKKAFESYLIGGTDLNALQNLRNFPSKYSFNENSKELNLKSPLTTNRPASPFNVKIPLIKFTNNLNYKNDKKNSNKGVYFEEVKKLIRDRILFKKKMKNEGSQYRSFNSKFLENFYSINKDYIEKIKNKDLISDNLKKKYFEKETPVIHKRLKNCSVRGLNQRAATPGQEILPLGHQSDRLQNSNLYKDYLELNAESYLTLLSERKLRFLKNNRAFSVPHISHVKQKQTPQTKTNSTASPINFSDEIKKKKERKINGEPSSPSPSRRDFKLRNFINYKEDLDFFLKNKGILGEELIFLKEISKIEDLDVKYIEETLSLLQKNDTNLFKIQEYVKSKSNFDTVRLAVNQRKNEFNKNSKRNENSLKIKDNFKCTNSQNYNKNISNSDRFSSINRNDLLPEENDAHQASEDDSSLPSLTEATLDGLYSQSRLIQNKIVERKTKNFANKIKQFLKLEEISKMIERINKMKLKR